MRSHGAFRRPRPASGNGPRSTTRSLPSSCAAWTDLCGGGPGLRDIPTCASRRERHGRLTSPGGDARMNRSTVTFGEALAAVCGVLLVLVMFALPWFQVEVTTSLTDPLASGGSAINTGSAF